MRLPKILYKYRSWEEDNLNEPKYQRRILTDFEIFFPSPARFNDPFDCRIPKRYDLMDFDERINWVYALIIEKHPDLPMQDIHNKVINECNLNKLKSDDYMEYCTRTYTEIFIKNHGLFSTTRKNDDILMWSHYGNSHKGFCIGFDRDKLFNFLYNKYRSVGIIKVQYTNNYPIIKPSPDKNIILKNIFEIQLGTKSKKWSYENEYRIIITRKADKIVDLSKNKDVYKNIILGYSIVPQIEDEIIKRVRHDLPHVEIYKAEKSKDQFKLKINRIT